MAAKRSSAGKPKSASNDAPGAPSHYVVFARRFRPNTFSEVVGQTAVTGALRQALTTGRVAQAYLFCGPRGVGKTSLARIVAKAVNCLSGKGPGGAAEEPCNECDACRSIQEGRALDVIEMDAATNRGIEEIRSLRENVGLAPAELRSKVYIIDEVHMLTREAWNAFLKTLEEPPAHVKFVFATTDPNNVPETILSRCQRYDLRRIGPADIVKRLKQICVQEKIDAEDMALSRIANLARGGLRDAEGMLDQAVNLAQGKVTDDIVRDLAGAAPDELMLEVLKSCAQGNTGDVLTKTNSALEAGADPEDMLNALVERLRGTLLTRVCGGDSPLLEGQTHLKAAYADLASLLSEDQLMMLIQLFTAARRQMKDAAQTRLPLEMALIRAARAKELVDLGKLVSALETNAPGKGPPRQEGPRPNWSGRSAGNVESRPAAEPEKQVAQRTGGAPVPQSVAQPPSAERRTGESASATSNDFRARLIAAVRAEKGSAVLASALTHAPLVEGDVTSGSLKVGFAPEQLLYAESFEKPEAQALLQKALAAAFGKSFELRVERLSASSAVIAARRVGPASLPAGTEAGSTVTPSSASQAPPAPHGGEGTAPEADAVEETEIEFADELPLRGGVPAEVEAVEAQAAEDTDDNPAPVPVAPVKATPVPRPSFVTVDVKEVEKNPLLQLVLKETRGVVVDVRREVRADSKGPSK